MAHDFTYRSAAGARCSRLPQGASGARCKEIASVAEVLNARGGKPRNVLRRHGYASSALAFVFALCMKYNRPSTGMNSKSHRPAAAATGALRTQIASVNVFCNANRGTVCLICCGAWGTYREVWICALAHYGGLRGRGGVHRDPLRQQLRILGRGRGLCHSGLLLRMGFESNTMTAAPSGRSAFESPPARAPAAIRFPHGDSESHGRLGSRTGVDPRLPRGGR